MDLPANDETTSAAMLDREVRIMFAALMAASRPPTR